jgi:PAS domain S-box-containing protein
MFFTGIIRDITERKMAEQALKVSEEKYKTMLNASPDGILLINLKGIITEVSEIGLELFGADTRDDLVGKHFFRFIPSDEKNTVREIIDKTMNEGLAQNNGLKIRKKNQSFFAGETSATLIQDPNGAPLSYMIIIRDISQRKKMETKQMHADRMANLGEMASGIAHEINQPLNIISMVMDKILFESAKTEAIDIEFLKNKSNKIFENITRIRNIIDHIRSFSRSHDDYLLTAFDINYSIENAVSMILEQFKYLGINLNLQLEKQIPQLFGNTYKFEQVIVNLLVNAKDAVVDKKNKQEENTEMIVGIKSYQENQFLIVEVTDNGIGITNDDINNIILPFYTTKDEGKGTGLGLSICYQIIKEMNGIIEITSDKLNGTKIKIVLDSQKQK